MQFWKIKKPILLAMPIDENIILVLALSCYFETSNHEYFKFSRLQLYFYNLYIHFLLWLVFANVSHCFWTVRPSYLPGDYLQVYCCHSFGWLSRRPTQNCQIVWNFAFIYCIFFKYSQIFNLIFLFLFL